MKIRVIRAFGAYSIGQILDPSATLADEWLARRWVEKIQPESIATRLDPETATASTRAIETAARGRRGRKV